MAELIRSGSKFTPLPPTGITVPLWPWILWNLWKARNKLVFENKDFSAQEIITKSIKDAKEWSAAQAEHGDGSRLTDSAGAVPGVMICNVDAAWNAATRQCGIGGVFSGDVEHVLPTTTEVFSHVSSALMAEAIAVHRAVSLAVYSNVRSLVVLTDSLSLINLLKTRGHRPELFGIMFDIYHFIPYFDVISFDFISRSFNSEADSVAKLALSLYVMNSGSGA
ncbi:hypothetical protein Bca4012_023403 [Brassica carinata]